MANMEARSVSSVGKLIYEDIVPSHEFTEGQGNDADTLNIDVTGMNFLSFFFLFFFAF
jgi:hypothetical protein